MSRLLLVSNSTLHGSGYLDHCAGELADFLGGGVRRVLFVPFALRDTAGYAAKARARLALLGLATDALERGDPSGSRAQVAEAEAVFVGGGNTFRLLALLRSNDLLELLRERVLAGMPYVGSSAGTNVACATIQTTNDMPIVDPRGFEALALVPFNVNPHYQDADPHSTHMGETREQRIREFHEENDRPVVGLREGAWLRREGRALALGGKNGARLFRKDQVAVELESGARLDDLLA
jgi:dipeptidase E